MILFLTTVLWTLRFLIGASVFSFVNVVIYRLPREESVMRGRSHCTRCGHTLSAWELIPCASYLLLRGKCHSCGGKISARYFWIEVAGGASFLWCAMAFARGTGDAVISARGALAFAYLAVLMAVAGIDFDTQTIYDVCHVLIFALGCAALFLFPEVGIWARVIGFFAVALPMFTVTIAVPDAFGGGDVKLSAACGWFLGWKALAAGTFFAVLTGGTFAAWMLATGRLKRKSRFAFGPFLAAGYALAAFYGERAVEWYCGFFR